MMNNAMNTICETPQIFLKGIMSEMNWKKRPKGRYKAIKIDHPRTYCCRLILPLDVKNNRNRSNWLAFFVAESGM